MNFYKFTYSISRLEIAPETIFMSINKTVLNDTLNNSAAMSPPVPKKSPDLRHSPNDNDNLLEDDDRMRHRALLKRRSLSFNIRIITKDFRFWIACELVGMIIYLVNIYYFLHQFVALLSNSPQYLHSILYLLTHLLLPVWSFVLCIYKFQYKFKKYYSVFVNKDNMDRYPDFSPTAKSCFDLFSKFYLLFFPFFFCVYAYFLVTKAIMEGEWTKMRVVTWWIYYFGVLNLWPSWLFSIYFLFRKRLLQNNAFLNNAPYI